MRTSAEEKNENGSHHLHNGAFETVSISSYAVTTYQYTHVVYVSAENYCVWNRHTQTAFVDVPMRHADSASASSSTAMTKCANEE